MKGVLLRRYRIAAPVQMKIALLSDLHGRAIPGLMESIARETPDVICLAGDMLEHRKDHDNSAGLAFLKCLPQIAPTLYVTGNHEIDMPGRMHRELRRAGLRWVNDTCLQVGGVWFAGLPATGSRGIVESLARRQGYRVLLCHHPEYYDGLIKPYDIPLTLSGHTHGGQWRLGGRGVYAPGQGFRPRYDGGLFENRLIVSRGLSNTTWIPRFGNPREWALIRLGDM